MVRKILNILAVSAVGVLLFSQNALGQFDYMKNPLIGKEAPKFSLQTLNSGEMTLDKYRDGQNSIVFFWATWCPHCRKQLDILNKNSKLFEEKNVKLVVVDFGEDEKTVRSYVEKNKIGLEIFLDTQSSLSDSYALIGVPTFFFLDQKGVVTDVMHGLPDDLKGVF